MFAGRWTTRAGDLEATGARRPGVGPFSGGQLTAIIIVALSVFGFPVASYAVSGSPFFLTDKASGATARVDGSGSLQTHSSGPLTARPAQPSLLFRSPSTFASGQNVCTAVASDKAAYPAGGGSTQAMVVTSIHAAVFAQANPYPSWSLHRFSNCSDASIAEFYVPTTAGQTAVNNQDMTFPSGLVIPADGTLYVFTSSGDMIVRFSAFGYLVPAGQVPANG